MVDNERDPMLHTERMNARFNLLRAHNRRVYTRVPTRDRGSSNGDILSATSHKQDIPDTCTWFIRAQMP